MRQGFPVASRGMVVGLLGGSFDPAHEGHVHITREALKRMGLDQVWWLVTPGNPLKALNCYVIKGKDRNLIVDTGFNRKECYEAMQQNLEELAVDLGKTDIFLTHLHADHTGLVARLASESSTM